MCCYGSTKAPWFLVFCKTEKWITAKIREQGRFVLFVSEGSDQKKNSVSNHLSLTFSQQYSAAGFRCFTLKLAGNWILSFVIHVPSAVVSDYIKAIL